MLVLEYFLRKRKRKMKTDRKGINLIKEYEGCRLDAYICPAGIWTIGYGHTSNVTPYSEITEKQANDLLFSDLEKFEKIVNDIIKVKINQNQFDALVSHTFNTGGSETLFKLINENAKKEDIYNWFTQHYITGNGKKLNGLINRRKSEAKLYLS